MTDERSPSEAPFLSLVRDREGGLIIRFHDGPSYVDFEAWAVDLARRIGGQLGERIDGERDRLWRMSVGEEALTFLLSHEHGAHLAPDGPSGEAILEEIATRLLETIERIQPRAH